MTQIEIRDLRKGRTVLANVRERIQRSELLRIEARWTRFREEAEKKGVAPEHDHWSWVAKASDPTLGRNPVTGLFYRGQTQGLMMVSGKPRKGRLPEQLDQQLLYVEFIETAPWNFDGYVGEHKRFAGIGNAFLRYAVSKSVELGYGGRFSLHSLPQSESFYRKYMTDCGPDFEYNDLFYFEIGQEEAIRLKGGGPR